MAHRAQALGATSRIAVELTSLTLGDGLGFDDLRISAAVDLSTNGVIATTSLDATTGVSVPVGLARCAGFPCLVGKTFDLTAPPQTPIDAPLYRFFTGDFTGPATAAVVGIHIILQPPSTSPQQTFTIPRAPAFSFTVNTLTGAPSATCAFDRLAGVDYGVCWKVHVISSSCVPIGDDNNCDGIDDDCSGTPDDHFVEEIPCGQGACRRVATSTCVRGVVQRPACVPGLPLSLADNTCDNVDDNCNGETDEGFNLNAALETCGFGLCTQTVRDTCLPGGILNDAQCVPGTPTAEIQGDRLDNNCDGRVDECAPGQTDWFCCSQTGNRVLEFNVSSHAVSEDVAPAGACVPLSINPNGTCSLRSVVQIADQTGDNGCQIIGRLDSGTYPLTSELRMTGGDLWLLGPSPTSRGVITPSTSCADDACNSLACAPTVGNDPFGACAATPCSYQARHRILIARAARAPAGRRPLSLRFDNLVLTGGQDLLGAVSSVETGGGALHIDGATSVVLNGMLVADNRTRAYGGGVMVSDSGTLRITDSVLSDNVNEQVGCDVSGQGGGATGRGGGLSVVDVRSTEIRTSVVARNIAPDGGGIYAAVGLDAVGTLSIVNSTISSNVAAGAGGGLMSSMPTSLRFSTVAANAAGYNPFSDLDAIGAGLEIDHGSLDAVGNVFADNWISNRSAGPLSAPECHIEPIVPVTPQSLGRNRIRQGGLDCLALGTPGVDPLIGGTINVRGPLTSIDLGPLPASRLASELVHPLLATSTAVNAYPTSGVPACEPIDQRHSLRPGSGNSACDLGAYELGGIPDTDFDYIANVVDVQPGAPSNDFSDIALFGVTSGTITSRGGHTVSVRDGAGRGEGVLISVGNESSSSPVKISACGGAVQLTLRTGETRALTCPAPTSCVFAEQNLTVLDRSHLTSDLFAGAFSLAIDARANGRVRSRSDGFLGARAVITGAATLHGVLTGNRAGVLGALTEHATVSSQALLPRVVSGGGDTFDVPFNAVWPLSPGSYGSVTVRAGATLVLSSAGVYRFTSLTFEADTRLNVQGPGSEVVVSVDGSLVLGDRLKMGTGTTTALQSSQILFYASGANVLLGHDTMIVGSIEARRGQIDVQDRSTVTGCLGAKNLNVGQDVTLSGS